MQPEVFERKYEIDSLCYPIRLAYHYWQVTGDTSIFGELWIEAVKKILATFKEQQRKEGPGKYRFERESTRQTETLGGDGYGSPVKPVGLIASCFRPSDDATTMLFLVPSNFMAVSAMGKAAEILSKVNKKQELSQSCEALANEVAAALKKTTRSEERRVGKECRSRWSPYH